MYKLKNYSNNLQYTQRFNYTLYQYYNDYQLAIDYKDDPTKIFYDYRHKSIGTIIKYQFNRPSPISESRLIKLTSNTNQEMSCSSSYEIEEQSIQIKNKKVKKIFNEQLTIQNFLDAFITTFEQTNSSDYPDNIPEHNKNKYRIVCYPDESMLRALSSSTNTQNKFNKQFSSSKFQYFFQETIAQDIQNILRMSQQDLIPIQDMDFYRWRLVYQGLCEAVIKHASYKTEENQEFIKLNLFASLIINSLEDSIENIGSRGSHLVLYIPNLNSFRYFFNPLTLSAYTYLHAEQTQSKSQEESAPLKQLPKLALINLSGKQFPLNLQIIKKASVQNILYITIFNQKKVLQESQNSSSINEFYNRFLRELVKETNQATRIQRQKNKCSNWNIPKISAFPIGGNYDGHQFNGDDEEIAFIFEEILFEQLKDFNPSAIMITTGNSLPIKQKYFNHIMQHLTKIADHRVILFPDLLNLFRYIPKKQSEEEYNSVFQTNCIKYENIIEKYEIDEESINQLIQYLISYNELALNQVDVNTMFNNFGMFMKIASGAYDIDSNPSQLYSLSTKYKMGENYAYLQYLQKNPQLSSGVQKLSSFSKHTSGNNFLLFLSKKQDKIFSQNLHKYEYYINLIDNACNRVYNLSQIYNKTQYIACKQLHHRFNNNNKNSTNEELYQYLQTKKKQLLLQIMSQQKICKIFSFQKSPIKQNTKIYQNKNPIKIYKLYKQSLINNVREYLLLDYFAQVIIHDNFLIVINYFNPFEREFEFLFGWVMPNFYEVRVQKFHVSQYPNHIQYFSYTHLYDKKNQRLYLYWPYEWNPIEQICSYILNIKYEPIIAQKLLTITIQNNKPPILQEFEPEVESYSSINPATSEDLSESQNKLRMQNQCVPRYGSTGWLLDPTTLYIFGGIYTNQMDFYCCSNSGMSIMKIVGQKYFTVIDVPKDGFKGYKLRPKINYIVQPTENNSEIVIRGGYGREFTDFYHPYSYLQYIFNLETNALIPIKTNRQIVTPLEPIKTWKTGKFDELTSKNRPLQPPKYSNIKQNSLEGQQLQILNQQPIPRYFNTPKYKFINSQHSHGNFKSSLAFYQTDLTVNRKVDERLREFKEGDSSWKNIQTIYSHSFASPQLFLVNKQNETMRIQLLIHTPKKFEQYSMREYSFPSEDAIIDITINTCSKRIYLLCSSLLHTNNIPILYSASLHEMSQIIETKQVKLNRILGFSDNNIFTRESMAGKSLFSFEGLSQKNCSNVQGSEGSQMCGDMNQNSEESQSEEIEQRANKKEKRSNQIYQYYREFSSHQKDGGIGSYELFIVGGQPNNKNVRWDYHILKPYGFSTPFIKMGKMTTQSMQQETLEMKNSYIHYQQKGPKESFLLLYSINLISEEQQHKWELKIQKMPIKTSSSSQHYLQVSSLMFCSVLSTNRIYEIVPDFHKPLFKLVKRYYRFDMRVFVDQLEAVLTNIFAMKKQMQDQMGEASEKQLIQELQLIIQNIYNTNFSDSQQTWLASIQSNLESTYTVLSVNLYKLSSISMTHTCKNTLTDLTECLNLCVKSLMSIRMQEIWLKFTVDLDNQIPELYQFIIQDKREPLINYIAVGQLNSVNLIFFRIKHSAYLAKELSPSLSNGTFLFDDYCSNLTNSLNELIYSNEDEVRRLLKFGDQNVFIELEDIERVEAEAELHEIKSEWFELYKGYEYWDY